LQNILTVSKKPAKEHEWRIPRIKGSAAAYVGRVFAPDSETAIKRPIIIMEFGIINPEHQKRLVAQRVQ
jgi:hypothetical protein